MLRQGRELPHCRFHSLQTSHESIASAETKCVTAIEGWYILSRSKFVSPVSTCSLSARARIFSRLISLPTNMTRMSECSVSWNQLYDCDEDMLLIPKYFGGLA